MQNPASGRVRLQIASRIFHATFATIAALLSVTVTNPPHRATLPQGNPAVPAFTAWQNVTVYARRMLEEREAAEARVSFE
jgi:hypothetical protein